MTRRRPNVPQQKGRGAALERLADRRAQDLHRYAIGRHQDRLGAADRRRRLRQLPRGPRFGLLRRVVRLIRGGGD
ncbi:MAG: hypothetical protein OXS47_05710 [Chloroflexota bacterium]|nr:hypothetical protein [Chloroflexota bacterium]